MRSLELGCEMKKTTIHGWIKELLKVARESKNEAEALRRAIDLCKKVKPSIELIGPNALSAVQKSLRIELSHLESF